MDTVPIPPAEPLPNAAVMVGEEAFAAVGVLHRQQLVDPQGFAWVTAEVYVRVMRTVWGRDGGCGDGNRDKIVILLFIVDMGRR